MSLYKPSKFFKIMQNPELQNGELRISKIFVEKYWKGIKNPVVLSFPNGAKQEIIWVKRDGDIWLQWEKIAKFLKSGYVVVFKYTGGSFFKVEIFGRNTLEIDYSNIKFIDENIGEEGIKEAEEEQAKEIVEVSGDDSETNEAGTSRRRKSGKRKMNLDFDANRQKISGTSIGGRVKKKAKNKKCSTSEAVNNENPSFELILPPTYAHGNMLRIPSDFSKEFLEEFVGPASIRVGEDMAVEVNLHFSAIGHIMTKGWKPFAQKYNLQVGDDCKFVMTQLQPLSFTITITPAIKEPCTKEAGGEKAKEIVEVSDDDSETNGAGTSQRRKSGKRKRNLDFDANQQKLSGSNRGGRIKKAKKCPSFEVKLSRCYLHRHILRIPSLFSREYLKEYEGFASIRFGDHMSMKVKVKFIDVSRSSIFTTGWKAFAQKYKFQVDDVCNFEMTQLQPLSFIVTITPARKKPCNGGRITSCDDSVGKRKGIKGTSRGCNVLKNLQGHNGMKPNTFEIRVTSSYPFIPNEFLKRHNLGCHGNFVKFMIGKKSWPVKVNYYKAGNRFYSGWRKFKKDCELKIGDICSLDFIDEKEFVFKVSIKRQHQR